MRNRNPRSPKSSPFRPKGTKSQPIVCTKGFSTQSFVARGDGGRAKSNLSKTPVTHLVTKDSETTSVYSSPDDSSSESDAITEDSTPAPSAAPTKVLTRSRYETSMRKKVVHNANAGEAIKRKEIIQALGMGASDSQEKVRASGLGLRGGISQANIQNVNLWDDTSSSLEDDSLCSSAILSEKKTGWIWTCSTCTEEESQQRDPSPPERPAKKTCGDRASCQQGSREVPSGWTSVEGTASKSSRHSSGRLAKSNESLTLDQTGSPIKAEDKELEDRHSYASQGLARLQDRNKDEKHKRDADKVRVPEFGRQAHAQSVLEISTKIIGPEMFHAEIAWIASRGTQQISEQKNKNSEEVKLKLEHLHDEEAYSSNGIKNKEHASHNSLREAVEAVWKTSLGKQGGIEYQDGENALLGHCYWDQHNEENLHVRSLEDNPCKAPQEKSSTDTAADEKFPAYEKTWNGTSGKGRDGYLENDSSDPVLAADDKVSAYKKAWKETLGTNHEEHNNYLEKVPPDPVFWCIQRDHENLEALVAREEGLQSEQKDLALIQLATEGRGRGMTEEKIRSQEVSVEAPEKFRGMLNERAVFHSKFKDELEQSVNENFKLPELLHLQKPKIDSEEVEVRNASRSFQASLTEDETEEARRSSKESVKDATREVSSFKESLPEETREVRGSFRESVPDDTRANNFPLQIPRMNPMPMHIGPGPGAVQLKLMAESESRIAAEAKASYFEACAKAAEKRMNSLLDERNWYYKKFVEEVEYNSDMKRLQHLMEIDKARQGCHGKAHKKKLDVRLLVASSVANDTLEEENEEFHKSVSVGKSLTLDLRDKPGKKLSSLKDDQSIEGNCFPASPIPRDGARDCKHEFTNWNQESERGVSGWKGLTNDPIITPEKGLSDLKKDAESIELNHVPAEFVPMPGDRECKHEFTKWPQVSEKATVRKGSAYDWRGRQEREVFSLEDGEGIQDNCVQSPSIANPTDRDKYSELAKWQQELEKPRSNRKGLGHELRDQSENEFRVLKKDEEDCIPATSIPRFIDTETKHERTTHKNTGTTNDKKRPHSPVKGGAKVQDWKAPEVVETLNTEQSSLRPRSSFEFSKSPGCPQEPDLVTEASIWSEEDMPQVGKTSDLSPINCADSPVSRGEKPLPLPTEWKKETKAELRRIIQQQELTWKMAQNAVEELARRLEVLENDKTNLQDALRRSRAVSNMDSLLARLEKNFEDFPGGFDVLYSSPIFEEQEAANGVDKSPQRRSSSPRLPYISNKVEIHGNGVDKNAAHKGSLSSTVSQISKNGEIKENGHDQNLAQRRCVPLKVSPLSKSREIRENGFDNNLPQKSCMSTKVSQISKNYKIQENGAHKNPTQKSYISPKVSQTSKGYETQENRVDKDPSQKISMSPNVSQIPKTYVIREKGFQKIPALKRCISPNLYQISKTNEIQENGVETRPAQNRNISPILSQITKDYEIQLLKAEMAHLRNEISRKERDHSPQMKTASFMSSFKAVMTYRDSSPSEKSSEGDHYVPAVVPKETEPEELQDPFQKKNPLFRKEAPKSMKSSPNEGHHPFPEMTATESIPELQDDPFLKKAFSAIEETPKSMSNSSSKFGQSTHHEDLSPISVHSLNGSWSHTPIEENGAKSSPHILENETNSEPRSMYCPNSNHTAAENLKSDQGNLQAAKTMVKQLADIFREQEAKFKNLSAENKPPSQSMETRAFYMALFKKLSQQLADFCHDLFPETDQMCNHVQSTDKKGPICPTSGAVNFTTDMEVEQEQTREVPPNNIVTDNAASKDYEAYELVKDQEEPVNLKASLQEAERRILEELKSNSLLTEKLQSQAKHISEVMAKNAEELARKNQRLSYEEQVNMNLTNDMAQTETSLPDLRSRNKELVAELDNRLQVARNEVTSLRNTVHALKIDFKQKEDLASSLKGERVKTQQQIEELRSQIQIFRGETDMISGEKLELAKTFEQGRTEADEQLHRVKEFISINEDLIAVAQSKENEIKTLTEMVTNFEQSISKKSEEAKRLSGETNTLSKNVIKAREEEKTCSFHHEFLQCKLKEAEQELISREEAVERLTVHLGKTIEGQHFILEEKEQLLLLLSTAQCKERKLDEEVQHLKTVIQDLEEKLNYMDAEMNSIRTEMEDVKTKRLNALTTQRQKAELRNRVDQLEEEIMEKEGQIAILTTSFP